MSILERDVKQKALCLPTNLIPLEEASASTVRTWVKYAVALDKSYKTPNANLSVIRSETPASVTYTKLLRGRWCIIASSNSSVSELSIWEIISSEACELHSRIYLPAPVTDGLVDDNHERIHLAVTIGTT